MYELSQNTILHGRAYKYKIVKRLGQGGGFYDRFLDKYKGPSAMVCREALMSEDIPVEAHDRTIGLVVSDERVYRDR